MGIYTLLLQRKGKILEGQKFLTVSYLSLTKKHKEEALIRICNNLQEDYDFVQISKMRLANFFRFL